MTVLLHAVALVLLCNLALGLLRLIRGPGLIDRVCTLQLFGTLGVGLVLVLATLAGDPSLRLAALLMSLLASAITVALLAAMPDVAERRGRRR